MDQAERRWPSRPRPDFTRRRCATISSGVGKRAEQALHEAEARPPLVVDQLERRDVDVVGANLTVADDAVAGELEAGNSKLDDAHVDRLEANSDISDVGSSRSSDGEMQGWRAENPAKDVQAGPDVAAGSAISPTRAFSRSCSSAGCRPAPSFRRAELVKLTGVPVAPLRDALRVLEAEGIVDHPSPRRHRVRQAGSGTDARRPISSAASSRSSAVAVYAETADEAEMEEIECQHRKRLPPSKRTG